MASDGEDGPNPTPPPLPLPSYPEMILEAIDVLGSANGSNKTAISGYIKGTYGASLPPAHVSLLTAHLTRMKTTGELVFSRNNYFRPDAEDEAPASPPPLRLSPEPEDPIAEDTDGSPSAAPVVAATDADVMPAPTPVAADADVVPAPAPVVAADAAAVPVKRGRGRPPKPKETTNGAPSEALAVAADAVAVPAKRGRGRPPKPKDPVANAVAMATSGMPRGRGRPPKKAKVAPIRAPASASGGDADANGLPVKRGRGRPRKVRSPVVGEPGNT